MEISEDEKALKGTDLRSSFADENHTLQRLIELPGERILQKILEQDKPLQFVRNMPIADFYWLIKKVGEDDSLPLLKMASDDQRQYLFDLEFWRKDRMDLEKAGAWLERMHLADPKGLVRWFQSQGESLAYYYFFKNIQVEIRSEEEDTEVDESFFTFDGVYYVKVLHEAHRETTRHILRTMANDNPDRYQAFLLTLAGVIPGKLEEDMYRYKSVRLAEHGFLPTEEALAVYAPLAPETLSVERPAEPEDYRVDEEIRELIPISPLFHARGRNILTQAFARVDDNLILDRLRLEFAGLCNQILSADGVLANDLDVLIRACGKSAGHINLALEKRCGADISLAKRLLENNTLVSVFRVGFGLVLELKWQTERWLKDSCFYGLGLSFSFWGDVWGGTLAGIMDDKPRLYTGFETDDEYKSFEHISELDACRNLVYRLKALDRMLAHIMAAHSLESPHMDDTHQSFHQMLFTLWARQILNLQPSFDGITTFQVKDFFRHLRAGEQGPPYQMPGFSETFIKDFMAYALDVEPELETSLRESLSLIWQEFAEEYEQVPTAELEGRFSKFIVIED